MNATGTRKYDLDDLLLIEEMSERLRVPVKTLRDWVYKRKIPYTHIGRRLYFSRTAVENVLAQNEVAPVRSRGNRYDHRRTKGVANVGSLNE